MEPAADTFQGHLVHGSARTAVDVALASHLSVWVRFAGGHQSRDETVYQGLTLDVGEDRVELGECRYLAEHTPEGYAGRLIFLSDVVDFNRLFKERQFIQLKGSFKNVALIISQRDHIRRAFKEFTADTAYDLAVYKRFFQDQDQMLTQEPAPVREAAHGALLRSQGRAFLEFMDASLVDLQRAVADFGKEEHEGHGFYFRHQLWEFIMAGDFMRRTNLKPRGYAGDSETMQMIYANASCGGGVFNKLMHLHPLQSAAAQAVRNRRGLIASAARRARARLGGPAPLRVMSVACGPACELEDMLLDPADVESVQLSLLDQDASALRCARTQVERIGERLGRQLEVRYLNESVRTMLRKTDLAHTWGLQDFIYSMGLFDYLTPPVARAVLARLCSMLAPEGVLLVGNYHPCNPTRTYMEYWMDWTLYYRTEEDMLDLARGLPGCAAQVFFEDAGAQMFMQITKGG